MKSLNVAALAVSWALSFAVSAQARRQRPCAESLPGFLRPMERRRPGRACPDPGAQGIRRVEILSLRRSQVREYSFLNAVCYPKLPRHGARLPAQRSRLTP
jgi:hypothetical protein